MPLQNLVKIYLNLIPLTGWWLQLPLRQAYVCFQGGYRGVGAMAIWTLFGVAYNCLVDCQGVAATTPMRQTAD